MLFNVRVIGLDGWDDILDQEESKSKEKALVSEAITEEDLNSLSDQESQEPDEKRKDSHDDDIPITQGGETENPYPLVTDEVCFIYKDDKIVKGVTLNAQKGDSLVIIGPSGSGKTTLLKLCAGLYTPSQGHVFINGKDINRLRRRKKLELMKKIGFIFQDAGLITNISVFENIALKLRYHNMLSDKEITEKVGDSIHEFGLEKIKNELPSSLSPGQMKLAGFARGCITDSEILFFDEPTTSIDSHSIRKFIEMVNQHIDRGGIAITITHNQEYSDAISNRMAVIHEGNLIAMGDPETIKSSEDPKVKQILKSLSGEKELADEFLKIMENDDFF